MLSKWKQALTGCGDVLVCIELSVETVKVHPALVTGSASCKSGHFLELAQQGPVVGLQLTSNDYN